MNEISTMAIKLPETEKTADGEPSVGALPIGRSAPVNLTGLYLTIVFLLIAMPVGGFAIAYFYLGRQIGKQAEVKPVAAQPGEGEDPSGDGAKTDLSKQEKKVQDKERKGNGGATPGFKLSEITVNVHGTRNTRFLRAGLVMGGSNKEVEEELKLKQAQITEIVQTSLGSKSLDDLDAKDIRQRLREEILLLVNAILKKGQVTSLHFTDLVVQ